MLQALVAYRNGQAHRRPQQAIAYITNWETKSGWRDVPEQLKYFLGAERKAADCGYQLEHFSLAEPGMTQRRLSDMLYHRGIKGAILASHRAKQDSLNEMDWSRLSAIKIGLFPRTPGFCRVMSDDYGALRNGIRSIVDAGYQRIGLVLPRRLDDLADQAWASAFLIEQSLAKAATLLPILYRETWPQSAMAGEFGSSANLAALERWFSIHQPDVIIGFSPECLRELKMLGLSVPHDVAFADLSLKDGEERIAGLYQDAEKAGEIAIELLLNQMERNIYGIPSNATTTLVESGWRPGASLPAKETHSIATARHRVAMHESLLAVRQAV
jgi:LacI family transcriptional regulator